MNPTILLHFVFAPLRVILEFNCTTFRNSPSDENHACRKQCKSVITVTQTTNHRNIYYKRIHRTIRRNGGGLSAVNDVAR